MRNIGKRSSRLGSAQVEFGFVAGVVEVVLPAVMSWVPFKSGVDLELPSAWAWNEYPVEGQLMTDALRRQATRNGERYSVGYAHWLQWSSRLSRSNYGSN